MHRRLGLPVFLTLLLISPLHGAPLAPGHGDLSYTLASPDSYTLPIIGSAADGEVLTIDHQGKRLHDLMGDKLVLLSFIYATCSDVNGCPLATQVLHKISRELQNQPALASRLRVLTLSFNPEHDTPEQMRRYGEALKTPMSTGNS